MHFSDAEHLMRICGPGRILLLGLGESRLASELTLRGACVSHAVTHTDLGITEGGTRWDCVVVGSKWLLERGSLQTALQELWLIGSRWLVVKFNDALPAGGAAFSSRSDWERAAVQAGFRKAPQSISFWAYQHRQGELHVGSMLEFERVPNGALGRPGAGQSDSDKDLDSDVSRDFDAWSDADMVRYALAATMIRPGDTVLDYGCGTGFGSAILAAQSTGGCFIGVDPDPANVAVARANFGEQYAAQFHSAGATDLHVIEDSTVDLVVSLTSPKIPEDFERFVREAKRVLKPDGRIVAAAGHLHAVPIGAGLASGGQDASEWERFRSVMTAEFLLEEQWAQTAAGDCRRLDARQSLERQGCLAELIIFVAAVDPITSVTARPYRHPAFAATGDGTTWLVAFEEYFVNPWLYRSMVQLGERVRDRDALVDLAVRALETYPLQSADFGAALTVLGYALFEQPSSPFVDDVRGFAQAYIANVSDNPHVKRWQISVAYIAARLSLAREERAVAREFFAWVADADFLAFSPLLATKVIASCFQLGVMALAEGSDDGALGHLRGGLAVCRRALAANDCHAIGDPTKPLPFGFSELAEVADMGAQCAAAIDLLPLYRRSPGIFWQKVDTKRFGVVSWAQAVERENAELRRQLGQ